MWRVLAAGRLNNADCFSAHDGPRRGGATKRVGRDVARHRASRRGILYVRGLGLLCTIASSANVFAFGQR